MLKIFKRFYSFIWKHKWWFMASMVASTIAFVLALLTPYFFKLFIEALQKNDLVYLYRLIVMFVIIQFAELLFSNLKYYFGDIVAIDSSILDPIIKTLN